MYHHLLNMREHVQKEREAGVSIKDEAVSDAHPF